MNDQEVCGDADERLRSRLLKAAEYIADDYVRTTGRQRPEIAVVEVDGEVTLSWNGAYVTPLEIEGADEAALLVIVTDYLRDYVMADVSRAWPSCEIDGGAGNPSVASEGVVWVCNRGGHVLAKVGQLERG
jgi:hypothetical protein